MMFRLSLNLSQPLILVSNKCHLYVVLITDAIDDLRDLRLKY